MPSLAPDRPRRVQQLTMPEVVLEVVRQRKLLRVLGLDLVDQLGEKSSTRAGRRVLLRSDREEKSAGSSVIVAAEPNRKNPQQLHDKPCRTSSRLRALLRVREAVRGR